MRRTYYEKKFDGIFVHNFLAKKWQQKNKREEENYRKTKYENWLTSTIATGIWKK